MTLPSFRVNIVQQNICKILPLRPWAQTWPMSSHPRMGIFWRGHVLILWTREFFCFWRPMWFFLRNYDMTGFSDQACTTDYDWLSMQYKNARILEKFLTSNNWTGFVIECSISLKNHLAHYKKTPAPIPKFTKIIILITEFLQCTSNPVKSIRHIYLVR